MAWSAKRTCSAWRSASEKMATVPMPISLQAQMIRRAISPRLAIRILRNTLAPRPHQQQRLAELDRLAVGHQLAHHGAGRLGLDLVHQLHGLDVAYQRSRLH